MATFNVSGRSVDHALQALQAGVSLQDRAALVQLPVGVGIACGPAVVGRFAKGANVSVLGEATNLAARLQAQAGAGEIVLSEEAYRRVHDWLAEHDVTVESKTFELKGFPEPVKAMVVRSEQLAAIV
jgi:adenylate cyclase